MRTPWAILLLAFAALNAYATSSRATDVELRAADGTEVFGDYVAAAKPRALILLFHQAGSNHGEYAEIAPRLAAAGYSSLAIDQRSGDDMFDTKNRTVAERGGSTEYLDALPDLEAALAWAHADGRDLPVIVWGSSYSSSLVFLLAARHPRDIAAVMAFSPGEYLGKPHLVRDAAARVSVPVYITQAKDAEEIATAKSIFDVVASPKKTQFVPKIAGVHGSSTLRADRDAKGMDENWKAVMAFLDGLALPAR
jgi:alpha-beta hydrolase superfamily lysophospholipase